MFSLILHAATDIVQEPGLNIEISGGQNLMLSKIVDLVFGGTLSRDIILLAVELFLALMAGSDNPSSNEAREEDTEQPDLPGEGEIPGPMNSKQSKLIPSLQLVSIDNGIDLPLEMEDGIKTREIEVLESAVPSVLGFLGGPEIDEGEELNIPVIILFVATEMMSVVFI